MFTNLPERSRGPMKRSTRISRALRSCFFRTFATLSTRAIQTRQQCQMGGLSIPIVSGGCLHLSVIFMITCVAVIESIIFVLTTVVAFYHVLCEVCHLRHSQSQSTDCSAVRTPPASSFTHNS